MSTETGRADQPVPPRHDVAIIGGGAAGLTAAVHAARRGLRTVVLERAMTGGQVINIENMEDIPGFGAGISGAELGFALQAQATAAGAEIRIADVMGVDGGRGAFRLSTSAGEVEAATLILAGGSTRRRLGVPGEEELLGRGVALCASCDGGFFTGQRVAVVGGGDSAYSEALVLAEVVEGVVLISRAPAPRAQAVLVERVRAAPRIEVLAPSTVVQIRGEAAVEAVVVEAAGGGTTAVPVTGVFAYVGLEPDTAWLPPRVARDGAGHIVVDALLSTSVPGVFAAGDIRQSSAAQIASAMGDGATAALSAARFLACVA